MPSPLLVERALSLVPEAEEFLPLREALIGTSHPDLAKRWASSSAYATLGKRVVDPSRLGEQIPAILERAQRRLHDLFSLVVRAIEEEQEGRPAAAALSLIGAGEVEEGERRLREAEGIYRLALEVAKNLREKGPEILALRRLGRVARAGGRLEEAAALYEQSYLLGVDAEDLPGRVIACQGLGNVADDRGQRELAREWYERGLELAQGLDRPDLLWPFYTNLAVLALHRGSPEEAEGLLVRARAQIERAGDGAAMMFWYNNRGLLLLEHPDADAAEQVYREALQRAPAPFWEMMFRINLGSALVLQERLFEAEEEARRAEELAITHRFIPSLIDVYDTLGAIARARRDEKGFIFYEQSLSVCRERGLPQVRLASVYRGYGRLHLACGRSEEAVAYLEQAREIYAALGLGSELDRLEEDLAAAGAAGGPPPSAAPGRGPPQGSSSKSAR